MTSVTITEPGRFVSSTQPGELHYEPIESKRRSVTVRVPVAGPVSADKIAELRKRLRDS